MARRYGIRMGIQEVNQISTKIRDCDGVKYMGRETVRVEYYLVQHRKMIFKVLYDSKRESVITVLPRDAEFRRGDNVHEQKNRRTTVPSS